MIDQREVEHTYAYDKWGRVTSDAVTGTVPSGVDDSVLRIDTNYTEWGQVYQITSYSDTAGTTEVNEVEYVYNEFGMVAETKQEHDGAIDGSTLSIVYTYDDGSGAGSTGEYVRLTKVTYPDTREVHYLYGAANSVDDKLSRVYQIADSAAGTTVYAEYDYVGAGSIVSVSHEAVSGGLVLDYNQSGGSHDYEGWDTFGRVINQEWTDGSSTTLDKYVYGYNRGSNRTSRDNQGPSAGTTFDEVYTYDNLDRLENTARAGLNYQDWTLDALGNWGAFDADTTGNGTLDFNQTRTANAANEIDGVTGGSWIVPIFDDAGNMVEGPTPGNETARQHYEYDAWNRLVEVFDDNSGSPGNTLAEFEYDGRNFRIEKTDGQSVVTAYYHNENQQVVEERVSGSMSAQYIWDLRYVDAPVLRDDGTNTYYYLNDANMNVTGLVNASNGSVVERYVYDPYGAVTFLDGGWNAYGTQATLYGNDYLFTGRRFDGETKLMYYRARYYDNSLGRFVNRDPIGYEGGLNTYAYVGGSPTDRVDPSGLRYPPTSPVQAPPATPAPAPAPSMLARGYRAVSKRLWVLLIQKRHIPRNLPDDILRRIGKEPKVEPKDKQRQNPAKLFRGMKAAPHAPIVGALPQIGPTKRQLGVKPGDGEHDDIPVAADGTVNPSTGGMSVAPGTPFNLPPHRRKDPIWSIQVALIIANPKLTYVQDKPTHGLIEPAICMTLEEYQKALAQTVLQWKKEDLANFK